MNEQDEGSIERIAGGYTIRFERHYPRSVDEVWAALTLPERMRQWVGVPAVEIDLVPGGKLIARGEDGTAFSTDTVLAVDAPRVFEHTFGGSETSVVRWELTPDGGGCLLRLSHTELADEGGEQRSSFLAGWHDLLDALGELLSGVGGLEGEDRMARWQSYKNRYDEMAGPYQG